MSGQDPDRTSESGPGHVSPPAGPPDSHVTTGPAQRAKSAREIPAASQQLVLWCSGYHICFTRRWSPVRSRAGSVKFFPNIKDTLHAQLCLFSIIV